MEGFIRALHDYFTPQTEGTFLNSPVPDNQTMVKLPPPTANLFANTPNPNPNATSSLISQQNQMPTPPSQMTGVVNPYTKPQQQVLAAQTEIPKQNFIKSLLPNEHAQAVQPSPTITPTPPYTPIPTPASIQGIDQSFTDTLNNRILPVTRAAGIPDPVAAAQTGAESTHGRSGAAQKQNNYHGVMQWDAQGKRSLRTFSSPEESTNAYIQTIKHILPNYQDYKNDPIGMLKALQDKTKPNHLTYEGDNANPLQYVHDVTNTPEWNAYGGGDVYQLNK